MKKLILVISFLILSTGCVHKYGDRSILTTESRNKIQENKSTKAEIKKFFGEPREILKDNNNEVWVYESAVMYAAPSQNKDYESKLTFIFDNKGIVIKKTYESKEIDDLEYTKILRGEHKFIK